VRLSEADIGRILEEDIRFGDLTVRALGIGEKPGRMVFTARRDLVKLSLTAIIAGCAECHRLGLFDTIMLFDEHRPFLTKPNDLNAIITKLKEYAPERAIMVEVTSEADAFGAADAMADVVQLEKFAPDMVARVVHGIKKRVDGRPVIAAAGGITAQNAGEYAKAGADTLVTSAPFYAKPVDIQVRINPL
jgi:molybdenum transport protein